MGELRLGLRVRLFLFAILVPILGISFLAAQSPQGAPEGDYPLLFEDDFERVASDAADGDLGKGWTSNSRWRANGEEQVAITDGVMRVKIHPKADHRVSVRQPAGFQDGKVALKFRLEGKKDRLFLNFADLDCKEVHAGHLLEVSVGAGDVAIEDLKTGKMNMRLVKAKKAGGLAEKDQKLLKTMKKSQSAAIEVKKWHELLIGIQGKQMLISIDGELVYQG